jgi:hypothetical protein
MKEAHGFSPDSSFRFSAITNKLSWRFRRDIGPIAQWLQSLSEM